MIDLGELAGVVVGAALGLGVLIASILALAAWIRAVESHRRGESGTVMMFGSVCLIAGIAALGGIGYGMVVMVRESAFF